ncbi:MAG: diguanylate cyclase [Actinobacteria bacterium]|nr:diguanylate cyclase [Actinomycetota bacterium]
MSPSGGAPLPRNRSQLSDIASLSERMGYFQALRAAFAVIVLGAAIFAAKVLGVSDISSIALVTAGYLLVSGVAEGLRRLTNERGLSIVTLMLLVDGVYLAWMMYETNGIQSPLRFLTYVHLIAVTLLASHRTGLKIALWHSLLFFVVYYAQAAGLLEIRGELARGTQFERLSVFNVMAFWLVALGTTAFSSVNERELRRRKADLEALAEMARSMEEVSDPNESAQILLDQVSEWFEFKRGVVLGGRDFTMMAFRGPGEATPTEPGLDQVVKDAFEKHGTALVKKPDPDENPRLTALMPFARNLLVVPLFAEGAPVGVLILEHPSISARVERRLVVMIEQFAAHAALTIRNAWLLEQVQRMAETDALTGVANRRVFELTLQKELARSQRNGEPLTLLLVDVDHFKSFNDTHGHQEGDNALKGVAAALQEASREFDIVARYGGEEFAVILPSCSSRESLVVAERLRTSISDVDAAAPVTASGGVATFPTHATDMSSLIEAADEALYKSKRAGRDRVTRSRRRPAARRPRPRPKKPVLAETQPVSEARSVS